MTAARRPMHLVPRRPSCYSYFNRCNSAGEVRWRVKIVGYLRVSTDQQAERGLGLEVQRQGIKGWAKTAGHRVVEWTSDEGVSGSNGLEDRLGLAEALEHLRLGAADGLVVYRLDRLARDLVLQEQLVAEIWRLGAQVFSASLAEVAFLIDDPDDPSRKLIRQVLGAVAEYERSMIKLRLRSGRRRKSQNGGYAFGAPPFGSRGNRSSARGRPRRTADDRAHSGTASHRRVTPQHCRGLACRGIAAEARGAVAPGRHPADPGSLRVTPPSPVPLRRACHRRTPHDPMGVMGTPDHREHARLRSGDGGQACPCSRDARHSGRIRRVRLPSGDVRSTLTIIRARRVATWRPRRQWGDSNSAACLLRGEVRHQTSRPCSTNSWTYWAKRSASISCRSVTPRSQPTAGAALTLSPQPTTAPSSSSRISTGARITITSPADSRMRLLVGLGA